MKREEKTCSRAVMTLYLTLTLPILLSLVLALFWGARVHAESMKAEMITDISGNSVLGEYNRELRKQYGLLFVDTAYSGSTGAVSNMEERLRYYIRGNTGESGSSDPMGLFLNTHSYSKVSLDSADFLEYTLATDMDTKVMQRQILEYMESEPIEDMIGGAAAEAKAGKDEAESQEYEGYSATSEDGSIIEFAAGKLGGIAKLFADNKDKDLKGNTSDDVEKKLPGEAIDDVKKLSTGSKGDKAGFLLKMVVPEPDKLSSATFDKSTVYSGRSNKSGVGPRGGFKKSATEELLYNEYLFEKFGSYLNEKENSHLAYEIEYLIGHNESDVKNLSTVVLWLMTIRMVIDFGYALSPSTKPGSKIAEIAGIICDPIPIIGAELKALVVLVLAVIWGFIEARNDVALLMRGKKVGMMKTDDTWNTQLFGSLSGATGKGDKGLDYQGYLRVMILLRQVVGFKGMTAGMMDIMELDIRKAGCSDFRLDNCVESFRVRTNFSGSAGKTFSVDRYFGFQDYGIMQGA
jgi:hypothetical protein